MGRAYGSSYSDLYEERQHVARAHDRLMHKNAALRADLDKMAQYLEPFCRLGGGPELQAFADLENDVIVWKNSGEAVTAGDVRRAREALAKHKGVPVSMMHFRKPYVEPEYEAVHADLEALAVAAWNFTQKNDDGGLYWTVLQEALYRPGVVAAIDEAKKKNS